MKNDNARVIELAKNKYDILLRNDFELTATLFDGRSFHGRLMGGVTNAQPFYVHIRLLNLETEEEVTIDLADVRYLTS